jgi:hypothetical protein
MAKKCFFLVFASLASASLYAQGYKISLKTPQIKSGIAYLTYYMGSNLNIADSAAVPYTGITTFSGKEKLEPAFT